MVHIIDHPKDEKFKAACRQAIESTTGEIVIFPSPINSPDVKKKGKKAT
jgi:hypothetical protein